MAIMGSDLCLSLSDSEIESISQEELVIFDTVQTCYSNQKDIVVLYTSGTAVEHNRAHWIGIFQKGWQTTSDSALHQWVPFDPISIWQPRRRRTIFPQPDVKNLSGSFQFLYVAGEEQVLGVSEAFRISDEEQSSVLVTSDLSQSLSLHNLEIPSSSSSSSSSEDPARDEEKVENIRSLSENALIQPPESGMKSPGFRSLLEPTSISSFTLRPSHSEFYQSLKFVTCNTDVSVTSCCERLKDINLELINPQRRMLIEELEASLKTNNVICPAFEQGAFTGAIRFHPYSNDRRCHLEVRRKTLSESSFFRHVSFDPFKPFVASGVKEFNVWKASSANYVKEDPFMLSGLQSSPVSSKTQEPHPSRASECTEGRGESAGCSVASRNGVHLEKNSKNTGRTILSAFRKKRPSENDERASCITTPTSAQNCVFTFARKPKTSVLLEPEVAETPKDEGDKQQRPDSTADLCDSYTLDNACQTVEGVLQVPDQSCTFAFTGRRSSGSDDTQMRHQLSRKRKRDWLVRKASIPKKRRLAQVKLTNSRVFASSNAEAEPGKEKAEECWCKSAGSLAEVAERLALLDVALIEALKENADLRGRLLRMEASVERMKKDASDVNVDPKPKERTKNRHKPGSEKQKAKKTAKETKCGTEDTVHPSTKSHSFALERSSPDKTVKVANAKATSKAKSSVESSKVGSCPGGKKGVSKLSKNKDNLINRPSDSSCADAKPRSAEAISIAKAANEARRTSCDQNYQTCFCHPDKTRSGCSNISSTDEVLEKWNVASSKQMLRMKRLVARKKEEMTRLRENAENNECRVQELLAQLRAVRTTLSLETRRRLAAEKDLYALRIRFWELISTRTWQAWGSFNSRNLLVSTSPNVNFFDLRTDSGDTKILASIKPLPWKMEKVKSENSRSEETATKPDRSKKNEGREINQASDRKDIRQRLKFDEEDEEDVLTKSVRDLRRRVSFSQFLLPHDEGIALPAQTKHGKHATEVKTMDMQVKVSDADAFTVSKAIARLASKSHIRRIKRLTNLALLKARSRFLRRKKKSDSLVAEALDASEMSHLLQASELPVGNNSRIGSCWQRGGLRDMSFSPDNEARHKGRQFGDSDTTDKAAVKAGVNNALDEDSDNWSPRPERSEQEEALTYLSVVQNNSPGVKLAGDVVSTRGIFRGRDSSLVKFTHNDLKQKSAGQLGVHSGPRSQTLPDVIASASPVQLSPLPLFSLFGCGKGCLGGGAPSSRVVSSPPRPGQAFRLLSHDNVDLRQPKLQQGRPPRPRAFHYDLDKGQNQSLNQQIRLGRCLTCGMRFSPSVDRFLVEEHIHFHHAFTE